MLLNRWWGIDKLFSQNLIDIGNLLTHFKNLRELTLGFEK